MTPGTLARGNDLDGLMLDMDGIAASTAVVAVGGWLILPWVFDLYLKRLLNGNPKRSLLELFYSFRSTPVDKVLGIEWRAENGRVPVHPMGSPSPHPNLDKVVFIPAQLARPPLNLAEPVSVRTVLGPRSHRPLQIELPVLVAGMGWGVGLSKKAKLALAEATATIGTATNTGEGPFLPEERKRARYLVVQYARGSWGHDPEIWRQADMIEIQAGQGAEAGAPIRKSYKQLPKEAARAMGIKPGTDMIIDGRLNFRGRSMALKDLVRLIRSEIDGQPVGVKLASGGRLEADLAVALEAGVDFVSVDGSEAASADSPLVLADDFGLPTLPALIRSRRYFEREGVTGQVSLLISGGLRGGSDFAKALALGADAVQIGTAVLFAMVHRQLPRALPFWPPTALVFAKGKMAKLYRTKKGAEDLIHYFTAIRAELELILRALGKNDIHQLGPDDLMALDQIAAQLTGLPGIGEPAPRGPEALLRQLDRWLGELPVRQD